MVADPRFFAQAGPQRLADILAATAAAAAGADAERRLSGIASLAGAGPDDLAFCEGRRHIAALRATRAGAVLVTDALAREAPPGALALRVASPALAFARAAALFHPAPAARPGVHPSAVVAPDAALGEGVEVGPCAVIGARAEIGAGCVIGAHACVGEGVVLGPRCRLHPHSSISHAVCGGGVTLHPGARVGQEGFGFVPAPDGSFVTMPQLGRVILGDGVEIGANSCVDRGALGDTVLGPGTRLDNLVHVAHNVTTGRGCVLVAHVGIAGSAALGDFVQLGGQVGVAGHIRVGNRVRAAAQSGLIHDAPDGAELLGSPALPLRTAWRGIATLRRLAEKHRETTEPRQDPTTAT